MGAGRRRVVAPDITARRTEGVSQWWPLSFLSGALPGPFVGRWAAGEGAAPEQQGARERRVLVVGGDEGRGIATSWGG